jgi:glycosyltransferase involved in cell wall biosynthesis
MSEVAAVDKVLHLYSDWAWDGPAEIVVNLCSALGSHWQVLLMYDSSTDNGDRVSGLIRERASAKGVTVEAPFPLPKHYDFTRMLASGFRLSSYLKNSAVRLVHTHRLADHSVAAVASYGNRVPVVRSVYYGHRPAKWRERFLLQRFAEAIIVPSDRTKAEFCDWLPKIANKLFVVPPGVDTDRFDPTRVDREAARKKFALQADDCVVGLVARVRPARKVEIVVEALALALKEIPRLRLLVLGGGKARNVRRTLLAPARRHRMQEQVTHLRYLNGDDYVQALAAMDVGVFLEPGSDKSGRAVREYMAMALPVIGCENGILPGLVNHEENGLLVEADAKEVAKAIIALAKEPDLSRLMGKRNFEKIRAGFSVAHQARATLAVYEQVVRSIDFPALAWSYGLQLGLQTIFG